MEGLLEKFISTGERLGLTGPELREYAEGKEREAIEREERLHEREVKREESNRRADREREESNREREESNRRADREREESNRRADLEREESNLRVELEREERRRAEEADKRVHERRMLESQIELQELKNHDPSHTSNASLIGVAGNTPTPRGPKLPYFDENTDDMDAYIRRFERYAISNGWKENDYATYLSTLLKGKALEVYARMPVSEVGDYKSLKSALLKRFQMTEGLRKKFHSSRMDRGETASQFGARLSDYFDRWLDLADITKQFHELRDFIVGEQLLHACPTEVSAHVREHAIRGVKEITTAADRYMEAHKIGYANSQKWDIASKPESQQSSPLPPTASHSDARSAVRSRFAPRRPLSEVTCFLCNQKGHKAVDCKPQTVYTGAVQILSEEDSSSNLQGGRNLAKPFICPGVVNGHRVQVLRDTGCNGALVKRSLVTNKQLIGTCGNYVNFNKEVHSAPFAEFILQSDIYTGPIIALCVEDPLYEVVVGNLPKVMARKGDILHLEDDEGDDTPEKRSINHSHQTTKGRGQRGETQKTRECDPRGIAAVQTGSQSQSVQRRSRPLQVPRIPNIGEAQEFLIEQPTDPILRSARNDADSGKIRIHGGEKTGFHRVNNLMYRYKIQGKGENAVKEKQLDVPRKFQKTVMKLGHESIQALTNLNKANFSKPRIRRWAMSLSPYRFTVEQVEGNDNVGADCLSRLV